MMLFNSSEFLGGNQKSSSLKHTPWQTGIQFLTKYLRLRAEVCTALQQCSLVYRLLRPILEKNCFFRKNKREKYHYLKKKKNLPKLLVFALLYASSAFLGLSL